MQKSFIERVFPKPKQPLLPQYDQHDSQLQYRDDDSVSQANVSSRIRLNSNTSTTLSSGRSSESRSPQETRSHASLQPAPLSASVIHHADPFIAVDRAAANLQETIQSLLDFQSHALIGRTSGAQEDSISQRSDTPTHSTLNGSTRGSERLRASGVVPVRQPAKKKLSLKAARQGIGRSMYEFVALKNEELRIAQVEKTNRQIGLEKVAEFEAKREAVDHEITVLHDHANSDQYRALSDEAEDVEKQIKDLEDQLMELKARHRHLLEKKAQTESASASQLSSYQGTLSAIDRDIKNFLRRPPVKQGLGHRSLSIRDGVFPEHDLYTLRPERRTLQLAREQWSQESELLDDHEADIRRETQALVDGAGIWKQVCTRIDEFESSLRQSMKSNDPHTAHDVLPSLDATLIFLQQTLEQAEMNGWTLLVCAIGAEVEAFKEARFLLAPGKPLPDIPKPETPEDAEKLIHSDDDDVPHVDLLGTKLLSTQSASSSTVGKSNERMKGKEIEKVASPASSNESLKATLNALSSANPSANGSSDSRQFRPVSARSNLVRSNVIAKSHSESEDDDPGPDFLISHDS